MRTTIGQVLVNEAIPEAYRDYGRVMSKDEADDVLTRIAHEQPDKYKEVSYKLMQLGRNAAFEEGTTLRLSDLTSPIDRSKHVAFVDRKEDEIDDMDIPEADKRELKAALFASVADMLTNDTFDKGLATGNPFALQVKSKARGNKGQLAALLTTPGTYSDHNGNMVPVFIRSSYAEGLEPEEYWSAAHGGRLGVLSTKTGTAKGGYLGKLLSSAAMEVVVTGDDCGTPNGIPVKTSDTDNIGTVLARQAGRFAPGTIITRQVLAELTKQKVDDIAVRSVLTCAQDKGICQKCAGKRESGDFPPIGYHLGQNSASALAEQVAQQALNCWAEGTAVLMGDWSTKPIEAIVVGDQVMGADLRGNIQPVAVTAVFDNGLRECVRTSFINNGCRHTSEALLVETTAEHKFLSARRVSGQTDSVNNFKSRILPIGTESKYFYALPPSQYVGSGRYEPLSLLLGCLLGDACYGKFAHEKAIPATVTTWDNASVARLLSGLFAADGSVYYSDGISKPGLSLSSASMTLLEGARSLLLFRFGILTSGITRTGKAGGNRYTRKHDNFQFTITSLPSVVRFSECIPLIGAKRAKLASMLRDYHPKTSATAASNFSAFKRITQVSIGLRHTYDIEVDNTDHLFVLANGLIGSNSKHSGKKAAGSGFSGFDVIKNLATIPETYPDRAGIAEIDGIVDSVEPAPQGGTNIVISGQTHYVLPGMEVFVKPGQHIEAGDTLSNGVVNPADVVRIKGIGEGRRYFADRFTQAFRESGLGVNRRNVEAVSRAIVNHVDIEDEDAEGDHIPGATVTYSNWTNGYVPRPDAKRAPLAKAAGQYLEEPALHYSIGTKVTKPVINTLTRFGYSDVLTNPKPVGIQPRMVSVIRTPEYLDDWMARLGSTYLDTRLLKDVQAGSTSQAHGLHPIPGLAKATEFGEPPPGSVSPY